MATGIVRPVGGGQHAAAVETLAAAFHDDRALSWIVPDPASRNQRLRHFFGAMVRGARMNGVALGTPAAATLWRLPGKIRPSLLEKIISFPNLARAIGDASERAKIVGETVSRNHPHDFPHWYLQFAGVAPAQQGNGLGGAVIRAGLTRAEAVGLPVYLETATEGNVGLYQRLGFVITGEFDVPDGGPHFWSMSKD